MLLRVGRQDAYYWRTQGGAELDLLLSLVGKRIGIEVKYGAAPAMSKSMLSTLNDLGLSQLFVVYPGKVRFPLSAKVEALPLDECLSELAQLG